MPEPIARKVLLIGWDAADWRFINPLLDSGQMPALARFVSEGVIGNCSTMRPILSPILWNSIATGKRAEKHGIFGFVEPTADGQGVRPVSSTSRKTKAIWNILTQAGLRTHVASWFASHPAEPINGVCIANSFVTPEKLVDGEWKVPPKSVHPEELAAELKDYRIHPQEIGEEEVLPFIPHAAEIDQKTKSGLASIKALATCLAQCASVHNTFTWALQNRPWDFAAVYYEAIDHFGHAFMRFNPPQMEGIRDEDFRMYRDVMKGVYRYHDMMLTQLLAQVDDETLVIIASDHGFFHDHLRPPNTGGKQANPIAWHRPHGIIAMRGPGVRRDERIFGATILDIVPTILAALGQPVGNDMDGKVLAAAFTEPPVVQRIESWDAVPGEAGMHPPDLQEDPLEAHEALQQLVDLGYIESAGGDTQKHIAVAVRELKYNAAVAHLEARNAEQAIELLTDLQKTYPGERRFMLAMAQARYAQGDFAQTRAALGPMIDLPLPHVRLLLGQMLADEGDFEGSIVQLKIAEELQPRMPKLNVQMGSMYLRQGRWKEAAQAFQRALEVDGDNASAYHGLSVVLGRQHRYQEAAESALQAVGIRHFYPSAHFQLGAMLARLNHPERAAKCFEIGLQMQPHTLVAHRYLARLHKRLGNVEQAHMHRATAETLMKTVRPRRRSFHATSSVT